MSNNINNASDFIKEYTQIKHGDVSDNKKYKSLIESGANTELIPKLLKMKNGCLTSINLPLDNEEISDCMLKFRLLSGQEQIDILDEMAKLKYIEGIDLQYDIYYISKILSTATKKIVSDFEYTQPEITEIELRKNIPYKHLLATGIRYNEFVQQNSPQIEWLTENDIKELINDIDSQEDITKKFVILNGLSLKQTQGVVLDLLNKLGNTIKQLDKFVIGS